MFGRKRKVDDFSAEIQAHIQLEEERLREQGLTAEEAHNRACRAFGNVTKSQERFYESGRSLWLDHLSRDIRFALRTLCKSPGFAAVAVLTLALGIGANTALFSVVNGVLLNPLPYPHPNELVTVATSSVGGSEGPASYPDFLDWARDNRTFDSLAGYRSLASFNWTDKTEAQRVSATEVSASFFSTLGFTPILGRNFAPAEDQLNAAPVVILGNGFWKSNFGSSTDVIGQTMNLDGTDYTIIGVLPANFYFCCANINFIPGDVYVPLGADKHSFMTDRKINISIYGVGRIKEGITLAQARADMARVARYLAATYPEADKGVGITITPVKQKMVQDVQPFLLVLLAAVGFVFLIACVNVANLLLARSTGRAREFAIRAALGASQGRVVRQLLTESVLLSFAGAALGLLLASWGTSTALSALPGTLPRADNVRVEPHVLLFTLVISLFAGILFGLTPALKASHPDLHETLKEGGRGATGSRYRTQGLFVIVELALAVVLLIGAGLTIRTLVHLWRINPGFDPHNVFSFSVGFPPAPRGGAATQVRASLRQLTEKISSVPGVSAISLMNGASPLGQRTSLPFWLEGQSKPDSESDMPGGAVWYLAGPDYLKVMHVPLLRGRFLDPHDDVNSPAVCVIDENLARKYFGNKNPIGKHLNFDLVLKGSFEIVGVVGHVNEFGLDEIGSKALYAEFYTPALQLSDSVMPAFASSTGYIARTVGSPEAITDAIRSAVHKFNSNAVIFDTDTMDHIVSHSLASRRFAMILLSVFAGLALVLSSIGVYGVISYIARRRTHEIGIRVALGAQRSDVLKIVLGQAARLAVIGIIAGLAAAAGLTRLMSAILFGVSSTDPLTFVLVAVVLTLVALTACYIPARRAMRVDPIVVLRHE